MGLTRVMWGGPGLGIKGLGLVLFWALDCFVDLVYICKVFSN